MNYFALYQVPPLRSNRENEHLLQCPMCQRLYALYIFHNKGNAEEWINLSESQREYMVDDLESFHTSYLKKFAKSKTSSAYSLFLADRALHTTQKLSHLVPHIAEEWKHVAPEVKAMYQQRAEALAEAHHSTIENWPKPFKQELKQLHAQIKQDRKRTSDRKPPSAFIMHVRDRWKEVKPLGVPYHSFLKEAAAEWDKPSSQVTKRHYEELFRTRMQEYQQKRGKMRISPMESESDD